MLEKKNIVSAKKQFLLKKQKKSIIRKMQVYTYMCTCKYTPPKFNTEPEKKALEKGSPYGNHDFQITFVNHGGL